MKYIWSLLIEPRCGDPDIGHGGFDTTDSNNTWRRKRYVTQTAWAKTDLTYHIATYSADTSLSQADQDYAMAEASSQWSTATTGINITKWDGNPNQPADIIIE